MFRSPSPQRGEGVRGEVADGSDPSYRPPRSPPLVPTNLLLVEDDEFVRLALTRALNRTGVFAVTPAEHGERALELLGEHKVDAILTDLQMPVMDGLTLRAHLLER